MVKGLIFDYGGTIDTNGIHWSEVLWQAYLREHITISKQDFLDAYVYAERYFATNNVILPEHNFQDVLRLKTDIETKYLLDKGILQVHELTRRADAEHIALDCYNFVLDVLNTSRDVLQKLSQKYPLVLVSNFYGNIHSVLNDFDLEYFSDVIESAVVGCRKPDARIFQMGVDSLGFDANEVVVIGDSLSNDIVPADKIGCQTIWLKGKTWNSDKESDELSLNHQPRVITSFAELLYCL
ncbi:MAG: HAD family hydrolase [Bacteroidaceae bacterium]|nr:HAD family hydrolase [Bacteroidaceae bacterium]